MSANVSESLRQELEIKREQLNARLDRITANLRRGFESDSKERAKQFEDRDVIDALGNEAREELAKISATIQRIESGDYGTCTDCGSPIDGNRLAACPYASECIDCATLDEQMRTRS